MIPKETFVKIIPKPKPKIGSWVQIPFWISLILLIVSIAGFFLFEKEIVSLKEKSKNFSSQITELGTESQKELENEMNLFSQEIKDFSKLFENHKISSKLFDLLRSLCHPRVKLTMLTSDMESLQVYLRGTTDNFQTLGEQFLVLKQNEKIKGLQLNSTSLNQEGVVEFDLSFILAEELIKK